MLQIASFLIKLKGVLIRKIKLYIILFFEYIIIYYYNLKFFNLKPNTMDNYELNENFREACYLGDINLIKRLYHEQKPDVNSKNKINGW